MSRINTRLIVNVYVPNARTGKYDAVSLTSRIRKPITGNYGREASTDDFNVGTCTIPIDTHDNFLTPSRGIASLYSAADWIGLPCAVGVAINNGGIEIAHTIFGGWIRQIDWESLVSQQAEAKIVVKDSMYLFSGERVNLPPAPQERTGARLLNILNRIGWFQTPKHARIAQGTVTCLATTEETRGQADQMLRQVAQTEGGRLYVAHGRFMSLSGVGPTVDISTRYPGGVLGVDPNSGIQELILGTAIAYGPLSV